MYTYFCNSNKLFEKYVILDFFSGVSTYYFRVPISILLAFSGYQVFEGIW